MKPSGLDGSKLVMAYIESCLRDYLNNVVSLNHESRDERVGELVEILMPQGMPPEPRTEVRHQLKFNA